MRRALACLGMIAGLAVWSGAAAQDVTFNKAGADPLVIDPATWETTAHLQPSEWGHVWAWQKAMEEAAEKAAADAS